MNYVFPSFFICCLLLPSAYLDAGNYSSCKKNLAFGRRYFLELLGARKKIARIVSIYPSYKSLPALFLFYAASYIYRHNGFWESLVCAFRKILEYRLAGVWHLVACELHRLTLDDETTYERILLIVDRQTPAPSILPSFMELLKHAGYSLEVFIDDKNHAQKNLQRALRRAGARRVFHRNRGASAVDYLYETGNAYRATILLAGGLTHLLCDCVRYVMPYGSLFCVCDNSEELRHREPAILEKVDAAVCSDGAFVPQSVELLLLPVLSKSSSGCDDEEWSEKIFSFLDALGLLSFDMLVKFYSRRSFPEKMPDKEPLVTFCLSADREENATRCACALLLGQALENDIACEVLFRGKNAPLWSRDLPVAWKCAKMSDQTVIEQFRSVANASRGDFVLFLQEGEVLLRGLADMLEIMRDSPEVALCGCRLLDKRMNLREAGAYEKDGYLTPLGRGLSQNAHFYRVTRSVPLLSTRGFLARKTALFGDTINERPCFIANGRYMRLPAGSGHLTVTCAAAEAICTQPNEVLPEKRPDQEEIAIDIAARDCYRRSRTNRKKRLNVLYYSPYPSHPANHGNRSTIQHFGAILREKGCRVHFALLGLERYSTEDIEAMRNAWDSLNILPYPFQDNSYRGEDIPLDGWYEPGLGEHIAWLCSRYDIDLLFCSYVFQSRMLDFVPEHILKVIDTHDKMAGRYAAQKARGMKTEFFSCTPEDEGHYLRRADIVIARRAEEAAWFNSVSGRDTAIVIPHVEPPRFFERRFDTLNSVGLVASANLVNLDLVRDFLAECDIQTGGNPPFAVRVAGQLSLLVDELPPDRRSIFLRPWVRMLGFVDDIGEFYASVDCVCSPVMFGTGINVKTVQAMSYGMPLVTTQCGCKGIETGHEMHNLATVKDTVDSLLFLHKFPSELDALALVSRIRYEEFYAKSLEQFDFLITICKKI